MQTTNVISAPGASPFKPLITMFHSPGDAFAMLEPRRHVWLPLILLLVSNAALILWYFSVVDYPWLQEAMNAALPEAARGNPAAALSKGTLQSMTVGGTLFSVPAMAAITALYFVIVSKVKNTDFNFAKGFALSLWASVPTLLLLVLGGMQLMLNPDGRLELTQMNPVSLNQMLFQLPMGHAWTTFLESISVISIWTMALLVIGYQVWAKVPRASAAAVVLTPYAVVYGIWAVVTMMFS